MKLKVLSTTRLLMKENEAQFLLSSLWQNTYNLMMLLSIGYGFLDGSKM
jgi:hypothetical protein